MSLFPLHLSLAGRRVLVVGGGPVAWRKARSALDADALVTVVAPYICDELAEAAASGEIDWNHRDYRPGDLTDAWLVFAATGDRDTDDAVAAESDSRRIFCVRASTDASRVGGSRSPAVLRRGAVTISVSSTDGADPRRATAIRDAVGIAMDRGELPLRRHRSVAGGRGKVTLVGGGPGDGGLLTLHGRRALAEADVVVVDRLAPREVLDELGPAVLVIEVGKTPGAHPVPQESINQLLIDHARAGRQVVRLKGGDPFVFGRGGEEVDACRAAGVDVAVVAGVTSAFAVPLAAGIPVTHRGLARQVTVLAGHDADGVVRADWAALARSDGTLVVLMGVGGLPAIAGHLLTNGMSAEMPVAIIENGCSPAQRVTVGSLDQIAERATARGVVAPAVIVVGRVAAMATASA